MTILINNQEVPVIIEHKNNKNLYIRVKEDLNIYVTCNKRVSLSEINIILEKNRKSLERMYNHQLEQNKKIAKMGGHAAKVARDDIEKNLGKSVISSDNALNYQYIDENKQIENK